MFRYRSSLGETGLDDELQSSPKTHGSHDKKLIKKELESKDSWVFSKDGLPPKYSTTKRKPKSLHTDTIAYRVRADNNCDPVGGDDNLKVNVLYNGMIYRVKGFRILCSVLSAIFLLLIATVILGVWIVLGASENGEIYFPWNTRGNRSFQTHSDKTVKIGGVLLPPTGGVLLPPLPPGNKMENSREIDIFKKRLELPSEEVSEILSHMQAIGPMQKSESAPEPVLDKTNKNYMDYYDINEEYYDDLLEEYSLLHPQYANPPPGFKRDMYDYLSNANNRNVDNNDQYKVNFEKKMPSGSIQNRTASKKDTKHLKRPIRKDESHSDHYDSRSFQRPNRDETVGNNFDSRSYKRPNTDERLGNNFGSRSYKRPNADERPGNNFGSRSYKGPSPTSEEQDFYAREYEYKSKRHVVPEKIHEKEPDRKLFQKVPAGENQKRSGNGVKRLIVQPVPIPVKEPRAKPQPKSVSITSSVHLKRSNTHAANEKNPRSNVVSYDGVLIAQNPHFETPVPNSRRDLQIDSNRRSSFGGNESNDSRVNDPNRQFFMSRYTSEEIVKENRYENEFRKRQLMIRQPIGNQQATSGFQHQSIGKGGPNRGTESLSPIVDNEAKFSMKNTEQTSDQKMLEPVNPIPSIRRTQIATGFKPTLSLSEREYVRLQQKKQNIFNNPDINLNLRNRDIAKHSQFPQTNIPSNPQRRTIETHHGSRRTQTAQNMHIKNPTSHATSQNLQKPPKYFQRNHLNIPSFINKSPFKNPVLQNQERKIAPMNFQMGQYMHPSHASIATAMKANSVPTAKHPINPHNFIPNILNPQHPMGMVPSIRYPQHPVRKVPSIQNPQHNLGKVPLTQQFPVSPTIVHPSIASSPNSSPQQSRFLNGLTNIYTYSKKVASSLMALPDKRSPEASQTSIDFLKNSFGLLYDYDHVFSNLPQVFMEPLIKFRLPSSEKLDKLNPFQLSLITWTFIDFWQFLIEKVGTLSHEDLRTLEQRLAKIRQSKDSKIARSLIMNETSIDPTEQQEIQNVQNILKNQTDLNPSDSQETFFGKSIDDNPEANDSILMNQSIKTLFNFGKIYLEKDYTMDCMMLLFCREINLKTDKSGMAGMTAKLKRYE